jgi:phosphoketolase
VDGTVGVTIAGMCRGTLCERRVVSLCSSLCQRCLTMLRARSEHPRGVSDCAFVARFTADKRVLLVHHGYPWLIHRRTYWRTNHRNLFVAATRRMPTTRRCTWSCRTTSIAFDWSWT